MGYLLEAIQEFMEMEDSKLEKEFENNEQLDHISNKQADDSIAKERSDSEETLTEEKYVDVEKYVNLSSRQKSRPVKEDLSDDDMEIYSRHFD